MKSSKRNRNNKGKGLELTIALAAIFVIACIALLVVVVGVENVNQILIVYAISVTIGMAWAFFFFQKKFQQISNEKKRYEMLEIRKKELEKEVTDLKNDYEKDCNFFENKINYFSKRREIAEKSLKIYRKTAMELEEILNRLKNDYSEELPAVIEAYKAEIMEKQKIAQQAYDQILGFIEQYEKNEDATVLEKALEEYLNLEEDTSKWIRSELGIRKLKELAEKAKRQQGNENKIIQISEKVAPSTTDNDPIKVS